MDLDFSDEEEVQEVPQQNEEPNNEEVPSELEETMIMEKSKRYQIKTNESFSADEVYSLIKFYLESKQSKLNCIQVTMDRSIKANKVFNEADIDVIKKSIDYKWFNFKEINSRLHYPQPLDKFQNNIITENSDEKFDFKLNIEDPKNLEEYSSFPFINPYNNTLDKSQQFSVVIQGEELEFTKIRLNEIEGLQLEKQDGEDVQINNTLIQSFDTAQAVSLGAYLKDQHSYQFESLYNLGNKECTFINVTNNNNIYEVYLNFRSVGLVKIVLNNPTIYNTGQYQYLIANSTPQFFATTQTHHLINFIEVNKSWQQIHNILLTMPGISTYMKIYQADNFAIKLSLKEKEMNLTSIDIAFSQRFLTQYIINQLSFEIQYMLLVLLSSKKIKLFEFTQLEEYLKQIGQKKHFFFLNNLMNRETNEEISQFLKFEESQAAEYLKYQKVYKVVVSPSKFNFLLPSYEYNSYLIKELETSFENAQNVVRITFESNKSDFISSIYYREILMSFDLLQKTFCYLGKQNNDALLIEVKKISNDIADIQKEDVMQYYNNKLLILLEQVGDYSSIKQLYEQQITISQALWKSLQIMEIKSQKKIYDMDNQLQFGLIQDEVYEKILQYFEQNLKIKTRHINCLLLQINGCTSLFYPYSLVKEDYYLQYNKNYKFILPQMHCNHQSIKSNNLYLIDYNQLEKGWFYRDDLREISNQFEIEHKQLFNQQDQIYETINLLLPQDQILAQPLQKIFRKNYNKFLQSNLSQDYFFIILKDILMNKIQMTSDTLQRIYPKNCFRLYSLIDQVEELNEDEVFVQINFNNQDQIIEGPVLLINETDQEITIQKFTAKSKSDLLNSSYYKKLKNIVVVNSKSTNLFNHKQKITLIYGEQLNNLKFNSQKITKTYPENQTQLTINIKESSELFLKQKENERESKQLGITKPNIMNCFSQDQFFLKILKIVYDETMEELIEQAIYKTFGDALKCIQKHSEIFSRFIYKYGLSSNFEIYQLLFENRNNTNIKILEEFEDILVNFADEVFNECLDEEKIIDKKEFYLNFDINLIKQEDPKQIQYLLQLTSGIYYLCLLTCLAYAQNKQTEEIANLIQQNFQFNINQFKQQIEQTQVNEGLLGFFWILCAQQFN
ncbi:hypothetical protein ABPG74_003094 [Tetrahymena malaccensis]